MLAITSAVNNTLILWMETCSVPLVNSVELKESNCIVSTFIAMSIVTKKKVENIYMGVFYWEVWHGVVGGGAV